MKSRIILPKEQRQYINDKVYEYRAEIFKDVAQDIGSQFMAMALYTLEKQYGWKRKRLLDFLEAVKDISKCLDTMTFRKKQGALDVKRYLKEKYKIDVETVFPIEVEER